MGAVAGDVVASSVVVGDHSRVGVSGGDGDVALGLTGVSRPTFWLGTALGSVFPAATWTIVGASVSDLAALTTGEADFGPARWAVLFATLLASVGIALFVRRALAEPVAPDRISVELS